MKNYYKILQVDNDASNEIIEKAYKILAKKYHPDIQPKEKKQWAEENFKQINEAYSILSDSTKRANYDKSLKMNDSAIYAKYEELLNQNNLLKNQLKSLQTKLYGSNYSSSISNYTKNNNPTTENASTKSSSRISNNIYNIIKRKKGKKDITAFFLTVSFFIILFIILWLIPFTRSFLINFYENNFIIKGIVDSFNNKKLP